MSFDFARGWYNCLNADGFLALPAVHRHMKKLGLEAMAELRSDHALENVRYYGGNKFRFQFKSKFHEDIVVSMIPAIELEALVPRCVRSDLPLNSRSILLIANGSWVSSEEEQSFWQVSLIQSQNDMFACMEGTSEGIRNKARALLHLLCETYIHYPVTCKLADNMLLWNLSERASEEEWVSEKLAERVLEILENLWRALRNHRVRSYFIPQCNMVAGFDGLKLDKAAEKVQLIMEKLKGNPHSLQLLAR